MKKLVIVMAIYFAWGALVGQMAFAETVIVDDKAYKVVEIEGEMLTSNEWESTTSEGYTDEYLQSEQYQTVKAANESLKRIKDGEL